MKTFLFLIIALGSALAPVMASAEVRAPVPDTIAERVKPCLACHTAEGRSGKDAYYPRLAGKPQGYLRNQLLNFKQQRRHSRPMNLLVQNLSAEYLDEIAAYFAAQAPRYAVPPTAATAAPAATVAPALLREGDAARKIPPCIACHGKALTGVAPNIPGLLGLPADYLSAQFGAWKVGTRRATEPDCMGSIAKQLSTAEVGQVAAWLAAQPMPADAHAVNALPDELPLACGSAPANVQAQASTGDKASAKAPAKAKR